MNLKDYPRRAYAIEQFTQAHCTELKGHKFTFVMDSGYDYELNITGDITCEWNRVGEEPVKEDFYECLKGDDTTYLLDYDFEVDGLRMNHLYVIDLEQGLVTMQTCTIGLNPKFPYLVKTEFDFGAIQWSDQPLNPKRHCTTGDMMGTTIGWHYAESMYTQHCYNQPAFYRITWPQSSGAVDDLAPDVEMPSSSDEVCRYVKIKDNLYLVTLTEENMERVLGDKSPFRSNNMSFLQNYDRMYNVGRTFGTINRDGELVPCRTLFGAFGEPVRLEHEWLAADNPFTV